MLQTANQRYHQLLQPLSPASGFCCYSQVSTAPASHQQPASFWVSLNIAVNSCAEEVRAKCSRSMLPLSQESPSKCVLRTHAHASSPSFCHARANVVMSWKGLSFAGRPASPRNARWRQLRSGCVSVDLSTLPERGQGVLAAFYLGDVIRPAAYCKCVILWRDRQTAQTVQSHCRQRPSFCHLRHRWRNAGQDWTTTPSIGRE